MILSMDKQNKNLTAQQNATLVTLIKNKEGLDFFCKNVKAQTQEELITLKKNKEAIMLQTCDNQESKLILDQLCSRMIKATGLEYDYDQMYFFVNDLVEDYPDLSAEDLVLFFNLIRKQKSDKYKVLGNKLTSIRLNEMLMSYYEDVIEARERMNRNFKSDEGVESNRKPIFKLKTM